MYEQKHYKIKIWERGRENPIETEYIGIVLSEMDLVRHYGLDEPDVDRYEIERIS